MTAQRFIFPLSILVVVMAFVYYWKQAYFAFDVSMYMVAARQILAGDMPYVEIIDINPPLVLYIHIFIVWLTGLFHIPPLEFYDWAFLVANLGVAFFISRKLRDLGFAAQYAALGFMVALLQALIAIQYGQREHLFMIAFIPYLIWRWQDDLPKSVPFYVVSLFTALLAFLKPGFLLILLSFEVFLFVYRRKILVKHWFLMCAPGILYLVHFLFLPQDMSRGFWVDLVPVVVSRYQTMGLSWPEMLEWWGPMVSCYSILSGVFVYTGLKFKDDRFDILLPIGVCSLIGIASALFQQKGWEYHLIPVQVLLFFGFPIALWALHRLVPSKLKFIPLALVLSVMLGKHFQFLVTRAPGDYKRFVEVCRNEDLKAIAPKGSSVVIFSIHPCYSYPVFYERGYVPGTRYVSLFPLAFFNFTADRLEMIKRRHPDESDLSPDERKFVEHLKADFENKKPDFIIFPKGLVPEGFDPYRYALNMKIFAENPTDYKLVQDNEHWRVFERADLVRPDGA